MADKSIFYPINMLLKTKNQKLITILVFAFFFFATITQAATIEGKVFSSAAQLPLIGVQILANGKIINETNYQGKFLLDLSPDTIVRLQKTGYISAAAITSNLPENWEFELAPIWELDSANQIYINIFSEDWFEEAVRKLYEWQVFSETKPTKFPTTKEVSRGELVGFAMKAAGFLSSPVTQTHFCDLDSEDEFAAEIEFMFAQNWINGYETDDCDLGRNFKSAKSVNRAEAVKIVLTVFQDLVAQKLKEKNCNFSGFTDVVGEEWFADPILQANCLEIVEGYADGSFRPERLVNFTEFAVILSNTVYKL
jgi:hypothetical protein